MTALESLELFRQQYGALHDAKMCACHYHYSEDDWNSLDLEIECYRITGALPHDSQKIRLHFVGVKSFVFQEIIGVGGHVNLYGISYLFSDGHCHFDFSDEFEMVPTKMKEESTFYVMSENFTFEVIGSQAKSV